MINVMLCGNDKVFSGMLITLMSMVKYTKEPVHAYIMTMDLTELNPNYTALGENHRKTLEKVLKEKNKNSKVTVVDETELYKEEMPRNINKKTHYTPYIFLRLLCDKLDEMPDKILYLDCDLVFYGNVEELYNIDMEEYEIAAARDFIGRLWIDVDYLNSGVVLMNLKKLRETKGLEKSVQMCITKKMMLPDQTALNRCCKSKLILEDRFNEQDRRKPKTVIRHFSMKLKYFPFMHSQNIKPWEIDKVHNIYKIHDYDDIYKKYEEVMKDFNNEGTSEKKIVKAKKNNKVENKLKAEKEKVVKENKKKAESTKKKTEKKVTTAKKEEKIEKAEANTKKTKTAKKKEVATKTKKTVETSKAKAPTTKKTATTKKEVKKGTKKVSKK